MRVVAHDCALLSCVLVSLLHCVCVPVRPVDPVLKQGSSKDMRKCTSNGPVAVLAVHVGKTEGGHSGGLIHDERTDTIIQETLRELFQIPI